MRGASRRIGTRAEFAVIKSADRKLGDVPLVTLSFEERVQKFGGKPMPTAEDVARQASAALDRQLDTFASAMKLAAKDLERAASSTANLPEPQGRKQALQQALFDHLEKLSGIIQGLAELGAPKNTEKSAGKGGFPAEDVDMSALVLSKPKPQHYTVDDLAACVDDFALAVTRDLPNRGKLADPPDEARMSRRAARRFASIELGRPVSDEELDP